MKYLITTKYGNYQIEAEDFEDALNQVYRGVKEAEINDLNDMYSICSTCPYWEVCEPPYVCTSTVAKYIYAAIMAKNHTDNDNSD